MSTAQASQSFSEGTDAADNTTTTYSMGVGDSFDGTLATGDRDWAGIALTAGDAYEIFLTGLAIWIPCLPLRPPARAATIFRRGRMTTGVRARI